MGYRMTGERDDEPVLCHSEYRKDSPSHREADWDQSEDHLEIVTG